MVLWIDAWIRKRVHSREFLQKGSPENVFGEILFLPWIFNILPESSFLISVLSTPYSYSFRSSLEFQRALARETAARPHPIGILSAQMLKQ